MTILIRCAFSGAAFFGTQKQPQKRTVQGDFEEALSIIHGKKIKTVISSRLDGKVNALDFALSYEVPQPPFSLSHLHYFLRRTLKNDIFVRSVEEREESFSARFSCLKKTYLYQIQNGKEKNPLLNSFTFSPIHPLKEEKLLEAGRLFVGQHDFRQFATPEKEDENTILTVDSFEMEKVGDILQIRFQGKNFLRYQVRFLVGSMLAHEKGILSIEDIEILLSGKAIPFRKIKAEPQGLTLEKLFFDDRPNPQKENLL